MLSKINLIAGLALIFTLAACSSEDLSDVKTATLDEVHVWLYGEGPQKKPPEPRVLESRYCYKTQMDVLCYDSPQPGKEDQFIGQQ